MYHLHRLPGQYETAQLGGRITVKPAEKKANEDSHAHGCHVRLAGETEHGAKTTPVCNTANTQDRMALVPIVHAYSAKIHKAGLLPLHVIQREHVCIHHLDCVDLLHIDHNA